MASTYVNDLRLEEIADGTEAISTNANTHTSTIADGATDPVRSMYVVYTGALDSNCTITIAPDTLSKVWFIKNGTTDSGGSGPYSIIIKQGSGGGASVTIANGETKAVATDGGGSGAIVYDVFANLSISAGGTLNINGVTDATSTTDGSLQTDGGLSVVKDAVIGNDLLLLSDASVIKFGANSEVTLTHVHNAGLILGGTVPSLTIGDAGEEDTKLVFDGNAQDFYVGLDDSADDLVIGKGSAVGTTPALSIDENLLVTISDDVFVTGRAAGTATTNTNGEMDLETSNHFNYTPSGDDQIQLDNFKGGQTGTIFLNNGGHQISVDSTILINADVLSAISGTTGKFMLSYYCTVDQANATLSDSANNDLILMSATGVLA